MAYLNKTYLIGNLTRDPEMSVTASKGTIIANFSVAVNRAWTNEAGQKQEEVTFIDCDALGKTADLVGKFLKKGSAVMVEGRLKLDQWEDKTTQQKRSKLKVVVDNVQFLDRREAGAAPQSESAPRPRPPAYTAPAAPVATDDVPF